VPDRSACCVRQGSRATSFGVGLMLVGLVGFAAVSGEGKPSCRPGDAAADGLCACFDHKTGDLYSSATACAVEGEIRPSPVIRIEPVICPDARPAVCVEQLQREVAKRSTHDRHKSAPAPHNCCRD